MNYRTFCILTVFLCFPGHAPAQAPDPKFTAYIEQMDRAFDRTRRLILDKYRPLLPPNERTIFDQISFVTARNSWNLFEVYARLERGRRTVVVSTGYLIASDLLDAGLTYEIYRGLQERRNPDTDRVMEYAKYNVDNLTENSRRKLLGQSQVPLKTYLEWIGITPAQFAVLDRQLSSDNTYVRLREQLKTWSLAVVLGHEIGHHVLGHLERRIGQQDETAADAYGFQLAIKAGFNPLAIAGTMILFDRFQATSDIPTSQRTHPAALCRWFRAMKAGWQMISRDQEFIAYARSIGRADEFGRMENLLQQAEVQARENCPR